MSFLSTHQDAPWGSSSLNAYRPDGISAKSITDVLVRNVTHLDNRRQTELFLTRPLKIHCVLWNTMTYHRTGQLVDFVTQNSQSSPMSNTKAFDARVMRSFWCRAFSKFNFWLIKLKKQSAKTITIHNKHSFFALWSCSFSGSLSDATFTKPTQASAGVLLQ